jgi:GNAT superfamily N-acetyltransferase
VTSRYQERLGDVAALADDLRRRCGLEDLWLSSPPGTGGAIELHVIKVAEPLRHEGRADRALEAICELADREGRTVVLTPSSDFGSSKRRLERWYRRHGFVSNRGRAKDYRFRATMIRRPR